MLVDRDKPLGQVTPRVIAVVVTHDRCELLRGCLAALRCQRIAPAAILIIDNVSSDGTQRMLADAATTSPIPLLIQRTTDNLGGAGGFALGIETALAQSPDWLWLMDDDSEPEPEALSELLRAAWLIDSTDERARPIGFLASTVLWSDGSPHVMNRPGRISRHGQPPALPGLIPIDHASFVSLLVSASAVRHCGLPVAEFFIGSDDVEYCWRIKQAGFSGYHVTASRVWHRTSANVGMDVWRIAVTPEGLDRLALKIRNLIAVNRRRPWGWARESLRVLLLPLIWRWSGVPAGARRQLTQAAWTGLTWRYERLIRHSRSALEEPDAHPDHTA